MNLRSHAEKRVWKSHTNKHRVQEISFVVKPDAPRMLSMTHARLTRLSVRLKPTSTIPVLSTVTNDVKFNDAPERPDLKSLAGIV